MYRRYISVFQMIFRKEDSCAEQCVKLARMFLGGLWQVPKCSLARLNNSEVASHHNHLRSLCFREPSSLPATSYRFAQDNSVYSQMKIAAPEVEKPKHIPEKVGASSNLKEYS